MTADIPRIPYTLDEWRVVDGILGMVERMAAVYPPGTLYALTGSPDMLAVFRNPPTMLYGMPVRVDPMLPPGTWLLQRIEPTT